MKPKHLKEKRKKNVFLFIFLIIIGVTLLLCGTVFALWMHGRSELTAAVATPVLPAPAEEAAGTPAPEDESAHELLDSHTIRHNGKYYRYNDSIINLLLIGVDSPGTPVKSETCGGDYQADVIVIAALDTAGSKVTLIAVSRDTMCNIEVLDSDGTSLGFSTSQLALSYSNGDGSKLSCELCRDAVSDLFFGLQFHGYAAFYLDGIADLNDALGGVTVTVLDDYPFTKTSSCWNMYPGAEVTLTGTQAQSYIRSRLDTVDGNALRMQRQKQYMLSMISTAKQLVKQDPTSVFSLYGAVSDYIVTDLNIGSLAYLATSAAAMDFSGEILSVEGTSILGSGNHMELTADPDALSELILDVFYTEVTP